MLKNKARYSACSSHRAGFESAVVILFAFHVQSFAYGESTSSVQKDSRTTSSTEPTQKSAENHAEFDEIAGQLQGMKVVLGNMKKEEYDAVGGKLQEMES